MNLHHYRGALLRNVWLKDGFRIHQTKFGPGISYEDIDGLFRAITLELCLSRHQLTGDSVRFLRKRLEMTQEQLGSELGCTSQAVAKWEKNEVALIPVASARMLRLMVLARLAPSIALEQALQPYDETPPEKMVFAYSKEVGWHCAEHEHAPIKVTHRRSNVIEFADVLAYAGIAVGFDVKVLSAFAENDQEFLHASKLATA